MNFDVLNSEGLLDLKS